MLVRSLLFAPANRPDLFGKFPRLEADLFALDLEDGTPPNARATARADLADAVRAARGKRSGHLFVRINPAGSPDFAADLAAAQGAGVDGLILAKTESAAEVARLRTDLPVIAGIESIAGVMNAAAIAAAPSVFAVYSAPRTSQPTWARAVPLKASKCCTRARGSCSRRRPRGSGPSTRSCST